MNLGRWVRVVEYRRALFSVLDKSWEKIQARAFHMTIPVASELLQMMASLPLAVVNMRSRISGAPTCSDASETGGGACIATSLSERAKELASQEMSAINFQHEMTAMATGVFS